MSRQVPKSAIVDAIIRGIAESQQCYEEWSGGEWLWQAPEYLITTSVAREIAAIKGQKYLTLENHAKGVMMDAGAITRGPIQKKLRPNGRIDIILWYASGYPRAAIEIKNQVRAFSTIKNDIERLKALLRKNVGQSSFQFGAMGFYVSAKDNGKSTAKTKLARSLDFSYEMALSIVGDTFKVQLKKSEITIVDDSAWLAACLVFSPKTA